MHRRPHWARKGRPGCRSGEAAEAEVEVAVGARTSAIIVAVATVITAVTKAAASIMAMGGVYRPGTRPGHRTAQPIHGPGASRPVNRSTHPSHFLQARGPAPVLLLIGRAPPPGYKPPNYGGGWRPGYRPPSYWWRPGGAIAAGAAIGWVTAASAYAWAGSPPYAGFCWYYTDASRRHGLWDECP